MPFPRPKVGVPRSDVGQVADELLMDPSVTELDIHQQPDSTFTIVPRGNAPVAGALAMRAPAPSVKKTKRG